MPWQWAPATAGQCRYFDVNAKSPIVVGLGELPMLQSNILHNERIMPLFDGPPGDEGGGGIGQIVEYALGLLRRQYGVIIFSIILTGAAAGIYQKTATP